MKELGTFHTFDNKQYQARFDFENHRLIVIGPLDAPEAAPKVSVIENVFREEDAPQAFKQFFLKLPYKGYVIQASPEPLQRGKWSTKVIIWRGQRGSTTRRPFSAGNKWDSESEAVKHCFNFGKQLIDSQSDFSVYEL